MTGTKLRLSDWVGCTELQHDRITAFPMAALGATLDLDMALPSEGTFLLPLWHWIYFLPLYRQSDAGPDGHAKRGGFLPPIPLPRRMWAGGRLTFEQPLRVGDEVTRRSTIVSITEKIGRSGDLAFVLVQHDISGPNGLAVVEEHDIVYRETPHADTPKLEPSAPPRDPIWEKTIVPDDVLLFRYSALTFNGHRIHYDRRYVTEVEGYPGLIVHGPLIATLLAQIGGEAQPGASMTEFTFRAIAPIFDGAPFRVCGKPSLEDPMALILWAETMEGHLAMHATARFQSSINE